MRSLFESNHPSARIVVPDSDPVLGYDEAFRSVDGNRAMIEASLSSKAFDLLSMAGSEGRLCVPHYIDGFGSPFGPCREEAELVSKGYVVLRQATDSFAEYQLTDKARQCIASRRRVLR